MHLEAVMVCVDYADFLDISLARNRKHFDKVVVVTKPEDKETQAVCKRHDATCHVTETMYHGGADFNKGRALNEGIQKLSRKDWVLITDADMVMPDNLRDYLSGQKLDIETVYGTTRYLCPDFNAWIAYSRDSDVRKNWTHQNSPKNIGVGFFQLANAKSQVLKDREGWYSERYGHCARSDRKFQRMWPNEKQGALTDIYTIHLGDDKIMGINWNGRKTPKFR